MDRGAWGAAVRGVAERDTTEQSLLGTLLGTLHAQHLRHRASFRSKTSPHTMLEKLRGEGLSNRKVVKTCLPMEDAADHFLHPESLQGLPFSSLAAPSLFSLPLPQL